MSTVTEAQLAVRKAPKSELHVAKVALASMRSKLAGLPEKHARELEEQKAKVEAQLKKIAELENKNN